MPRVASILASSDDSALVEALVEGHPAAKIELFDRYAGQVERILVRILGCDAELSDLLNEVFARSLGGIDTLENPAALRGWLTGIAITTARECIRKRARGRWLRFFATEDLPQAQIVGVDEEAREALRATYAILGRMGADDRIAFALRHVEGLELREIASTCGASLNTVKRRLARAERRFWALAEREPALGTWLQRGGS